MIASLIGRAGRARISGTFGRYVARVLTIALVVGLVETATAQPRQAAEAAIDAALAKVSPSLVRIHVVTYAYEDGR